MIIPVLCFNCGNQVGSLWRYYQARLRELKGDKATEPFYLDGRKVPETPEKKINFLYVISFKKSISKINQLTYYISNYQKSWSSFFHLFLF